MAGESGYPRLARGLTIFAIGDIHGRADLLAPLHEAIDAACVEVEGRVLEVYLGDYVDRGAQVCETIELLLQRERRREMIMLRGNHESMLQSFLDEELDLRDWARFGGLPTLLSYGVQPSLWRSPRDCLAELRARMPAAHVTFLHTLLDWAWLGDYFFVHAGVRPGVRLDAQSARDACWIGEDFLRDRRTHGAVVIHGHTTTPAPELLGNRINLDTGAFFSGRLTCLRLDYEGARLFSAERGGVSGPVLSPQRGSGGFKPRRAGRRNDSPLARATPRLNALRSGWRARTALFSAIAARCQEPVTGYDV